MSFDRDGGRRNFGPREMHKAVCADCGKECEVPFKPQEGRPVSFTSWKLKPYESNYAAHDLEL